MLRFLAHRLLTLVPTLLAVLTLVFVLVRIVPGDPALIILGDQATPDAIARFHHETGLDTPIWQQYFAFLTQLASGDLGVSMISHRPVLSAVLAVLPYTLELSIAGVLVGVLLGVPLGVVAAQSNGGWTDWLVRIFTLGGLSFPAFISAVMMLLVFSVWLGWFPVISTGKPLTDPWGRLMSLALPALNLGLVMMAYVARVTRGGMMNVMRSDFIRTARAKGVPVNRIVWKHALRNVLLAVVTFTGLYFSVLIGNSVLTEIVFNRPGLGKLVIGALERRDYTLLQGLVVAYGVLVVIVNALTDLCYGLVDPRVKTG